MASNISDILTDALIYVGAYAQGQTPNTDDMSLALRVMNRKIDSLSAEKLSMVGLKRASYPLTGAANYTYGPGQTWSAMARPIKIKSASTYSASATQHEARLPTAEVWSAILDKTRTGIFIEDLFYDNGFPTGIVYVTPMPSGGQCILWTYEAIPQLAGTTGTVSLAPGFEQTLVTIAAVDLCSAFQRPLTAELNNAAMQAKQVIVELCAEIYNAPAQPPEGPNPASPPALRTV
jgi:hypothetical protein